MIPKPIPTPVQVTMTTPMYADDLDELDAMTERVKVLGAKFPARTRLVRLAIHRLLELDPAEIVAALDAMPAARRAS